MKKQILMGASVLAVPLAFGITAFADKNTKATQVTAKQTFPQQTGTVVSSDQANSQSDTSKSQATQTSDNPETAIQAPSAATAIAIAAITGIGSAILLTTAREQNQ